MICKNCGNEVVEGENFCTNCGKAINNITVEENNTNIKDNKENLNKKKNKVSKKLIIILAVILLVIIICVGAVILNNRKTVEQNQDESQNNSEVETLEKEYITQDSDVSPTGKEFIGQFSDIIVEIYEKRKEEGYNKYEYYETSIENIKAYSTAVLLDKYGSEKINDQKYYYNSNNNHIIGFATTVNYLNYTTATLEKLGMTYQEYLGSALNSDITFSMNFQNMSEEEKNSTEVKEKYNKYQEYLVNNTSAENKVVTFDNYTCSYNVFGTDMLYVYTNFNNDNNKKEMLLLAHNENNNPEEEIKLWYNTVFTTNEIQQENAEETNLLDEIYQKYPSLKDKEGVICTNRRQLLAIR